MQFLGREKRSVSSGQVIDNVNENAFLIGITFEKQTFQTKAKLKMSLPNEIVLTGSLGIQAGIQS